MRLSINGRVVKSYEVEVSAPRRVESFERFQQLGSCLTVLHREEEQQILEEPEPAEVQEDFKRPETREETERVLREAEERGAEIIAEAEAKAGEILAAAAAEVQELRIQARAELEGLRQELKESVHAEIYPLARAEGYKAGRQAGEAEAKGQIEKAQQLILLAQRAVQEEYAKVDGDLLHLALKIAQRILRAAIGVEPQRLAAIVHSLTLLPLEREGWRLHVAAGDAQLVEGKLSCPWVIDESLAAGDCFLECQEGIFDARLEAQLDKLEHYLREELEHGSVESISGAGG